MSNTASEQERACVCVCVCTRTTTRGYAHEEEENTMRATITTNHPRARCRRAELVFDECVRKRSEGTSVDMHLHLAEVGKHICARGEEETSSDCLSFNALDNDKCNQA